MHGFACSQYHSLVDPAFPQHERFSQAKMNLFVGLPHLVGNRGCWDDG